MHAVNRGSIPRDSTKYWYIFYEDWCPLCNRTRIEKERVYDKPKPKNYWERHIETERYDYCG